MNNKVGALMLMEMLQYRGYQDEEAMFYHFSEELQILHNLNLIAAVAPNFFQLGLQAKSRAEITEVIQALLFIIFRLFIGRFEQMNL